MRKKSPYPQIGTDAGNEIIGKCYSCNIPQRRGDPFIVKLGGKVQCQQCYRGDSAEEIGTKERDECGGV